MSIQILHLVSGETLIADISFISPTEIQMDLPLLIHQHFDEEVSFSVSQWLTLSIPTEKVTISKDKIITTTPVKRHYYESYSLASFEIISMYLTNNAKYMCDEFPDTHKEINQKLIEQLSELKENFSNKYNLDIPENEITSDTIIH